MLRAPYRRPCVSGGRGRERGRDADEAEEGSLLALAPLSSAYPWGPRPPMWQLSLGWWQLSVGFSDWCAASKVGRTPSYLFPLRDECTHVQGRCGVSKKGWPASPLQIFKRRRCSSDIRRCRRAV